MSSSSKPINKCQHCPRNIFLVTRYPACHSHKQVTEITMSFITNFNGFNSISHHHGSHTIQPSQRPKINEFLSSQFNSAESDRANYVNVPSNDRNSLGANGSHHNRHNRLQQLLPQIETNNLTSNNIANNDLDSPPENPFCQQQVRTGHSRSHSHVHTRTHSLSQHYYHPLAPLDDFVNYYNVSNAIQPTRSHYPTSINDSPPPLINNNNNHNHHHHHHQNAPVFDQLSPIQIMKLCCELGQQVDSPPPVPPSRNYTIMAGQDLKVMFPQRRVLKTPCSSPLAGVSLAPGSVVTALGPSREDRTKITILIGDQQVDLPYQLTYPPHIYNWN